MQDVLIPFNPLLGKHYNNPSEGMLVVTMMIQISLREF